VVYLAVQIALREALLDLDSEAMVRLAGRAGHAGVNESCA
jgi:hypothetical protein